MRGAGSGGVAGLAFAALVVLAGCGGPSSEVLTIPPEGARLEAQVFMSARGPDRPDARFHFPTLGARETVVTLRSTEGRAMAARLGCDGPARLHLEGPGDPGLFIRPGATRAFTLPPRHEKRRPRLVLPPDTARCTLDWGDGNRLALIADDRGEPVAARPAASPAAACPVPPTPGDALALAFFATRDLAQTCPRPTGAYAVFPDESDALQLRLERLTGAPVPRAALERADPDMPLDFSRAPRFDEIAISYLQVRADISGYLVVRALAFHAARGTKVRIAVSKNLIVDLDRLLLEGFASQFPNVQLEYFRYAPRGFAPIARTAGSFANSHHIKLFAALSPEAGQSFAILGGRNLHDGFFFPGIENRAERPYLHVYERGLTSNVIKYYEEYEDFEIALFDRAAVADVLDHFDGFWNRDTRGDVMQSAQVPVSAPARKGDRLMRHYIALPWADGMAQTELFTDLIDAAQEEIVAITPMLYPPAEIDGALRRAAARGVRVRFVTSIIRDEPAAVFVNALAVDYAARRSGEFEILAYEPEDRSLHTKLLVIDNRLALIGSSNFNRRSFLGDSENGLVFLDASVARDVRRVIDRATARARPIETPPQLRQLGRALNALPFLANQL